MRLCVCTRACASDQHISHTHRTFTHTLSHTRSARFAADRGCTTHTHTHTYTHIHTGSRRIVDEFESHLSEASSKCERNKQKVSERQHVCLFPFLFFFLTRQNTPEAHTCKEKLIRFKYFLCMFVGIAVLRDRRSWALTACSWALTACSSFSFLMSV